MSDHLDALPKSVLVAKLRDATARVERLSELEREGEGLARALLLFHAVPSWMYAQREQWFALT